jgi:formiminoglutamase
MKNFEYISQKQVKEIVSLRNGEIKVGEKCIIPINENLNEILTNEHVKFIIFGISEDIGVQANFGNKGTNEMFNSFIKAFLNIQYNEFNLFEHVAVLGQFKFDDYQKEAEQLNAKIPKERNRLFEMVNEIDQDVSKLCFQIAKHHKIPIIIGGGHNNCYGIIKGISLSKGKPINTINIDPHSDFRILEGRHSGNGFSYAHKDGFLNKYYILGLHENYSSKEVLDKLKKTENIQMTTFEELFIRKNKTSKQLYFEIQSFFGHRNYGIEIDLDSIPNILTSAFTPEGIQINQVRTILFELQKQKKILYLHICEGIPNKIFPMHTEKTITYLLSDFIKNYYLDHKVINNF